MKTGFAAGLQDQATGREDGIPHIRPLNLLENGNLTLEGTKRVPSESVVPEDVCRRGEVLFNNTNSPAWVGKSVVFDLPVVCACSNHITRICCLDEVLPGFLAESLNTLRGIGYFKTLSTSFNNQAGVNSKTLAETKIPVPPLDVQRRLVTELDAARAERDRALADAERLLASIDEIVKQMLGLPDLDLPLQAGYAIRLSTAKAGSTLSADYFHPERMQAIKLIQRVPNAPLSRLVEFKREIIKSPGESRYIGLASVASGTGQLTDVTESAGGQCFAFAPGDVLYGRLRPYLNKVWLATFEGVSSTEFHVMRPFDADRLRSEYLAVVMRTNLIVAQTKHMMTGNTHPRIANEDVVNLLVPLADPATQTHIVEETLARQAESARLRANVETVWRNARERFEQQLLQGGKT